MSERKGQQLEQYTETHPHEVLLVKLELAGEVDEVAIFKGFSSSLMHPTTFDPDIPIIPETAKIVSIDRAKAPYNPSNPQYIQQDLSWEAFQLLL
ncbi:hypothetical protein V2H45_02470 [Tumidithrix elongata RA019]|uniref:DUF7734 domain-containing protein n=1 Tax=Tumidithrix elongata BACA0141 TaxID=2716417 RepID=A0AAW9PXC2_9CYAN|nr:hypothetical protein [Tumidithrix elongata RA019]